MIDRGAARRYAEAFVNVLEKNQRLEPGLVELKAVSGTYAQSKSLQRFLGSPEIAPEDKEGLLSRLWSGAPGGVSGAASSSGSQAAGQETLSLLRLLLRWDRIDHLAVLMEEAVKAAEARQGILRGTVTTAHPISSAEMEQVAQAVGRRMGKQVMLERRVDPALLGGARVAVGSTLLDGSVRTQLARVREQLLGAKVNS